MSNSDLTSVLFVLLLLVALAQLLGYLFMMLRQPKVVGEILAGVVLGPAILGRLPSALWILEATQRQASILNFVYWLGLLLLMFLSGAETQQLFSREERHEVGVSNCWDGYSVCPWVGTGPMADWAGLGGPQW